MSQEKETAQESSAKIVAGEVVIGASSDAIVHISSRGNENLLEVFPGLATISIFLENAADAEVIEAAVRAVAEQLGLDIVADSPPVFGSWFKRLLAHGRAEFTEDRVRAAVQGAVRALELEQVEKRQAHVNATNVGAIADLIDKLADTPAAVIQIGSLIVIKAAETLVVRELTQGEQATLRENPILLTNPEAAAAIFHRWGEGTPAATVEGASDVPRIIGE